jgi:hypothetical protein
MNPYLLQGDPARPTFAADLTESESASAIMSKHVAYWTDLLDKDVAVAFGPVATHRAYRAWAVVEAPDEQGSGYWPKAAR